MNRPLESDYTGNGTAGRENMTAPTGFLFQMPNLKDTHSQYVAGWNDALDKAAARIGEMKGFGKTTQDSFAIFIKGLKK